MDSKKLWFRRQNNEICSVRNLFGFRSRVLREKLPVKCPVQTSRRPPRRPTRGPRLTQKHSIQVPFLQGEWRMPKVVSRRQTRWKKKNKRGDREQWKGIVLAGPSGTSRVWEGVAKALCCFLGRAPKHPPGSPFPYLGSPSRSDRAAKAGRWGRQVPLCNNEDRRDNEDSDLSIDDDARFGMSSNNLLSVEMSLRLTRPVL